MSRIINQNTEPLFIFDMPDDHLLSETISVKGEKGERGDPTKLSDLENDEGFIDNTVDDLANYYDKTATDTKLDAKLDKTTFNAYEIPSNFFTDDETVAAEGSSIDLANTADAYIKNITLYGDAEQSANPTLNNLVAVQTATGEQTITITDNDQQSQVCKLNLGKNLFDKTAMGVGYIDSNGDVISTSTTFGHSDYMPVIPSVKYTYSGTTNQTNYGAKAAWYDATKTLISVFGFGNSGTVTAPSNAHYVRFSVRVSTGNAHDEETFQFERGEQATSYASYFEPIELCRIDGYKDSIFKQDGKWYKRSAVKKIKLGDYSYTIYQGNVYYAVVELDAISGNSVMLCNAFKGDTSGTRLSNTIFYNKSINHINIYPNADTIATYTTAALFQQALNDNNVYAYYILAEPIDEEITNDVLIVQLEALTRSKTYSGATRIWVAGALPVSLGVEAYKDGWSGTLGAISTEIGKKADRADVAQKPYYFNSVAEMQAQNLAIGDVAITTGYYSLNDGGAAMYKIIDSDLQADNGSIIALANGLKASLVVENDTINVKQFGAKGDGVTNDSVALINALKFNGDNYTKVIFNKNETYFATGTLYLYSNTDIELNNSTILSAAELRFLTNAEAMTTAGYGAVKNISVKNGTLKGGTGGIIFGLFHASGVEFKNIEFVDCGRGTHTIDMGGCDHVLIKDCHFIGSYIAEMNNFREVIQTDYATYAGLPYWGGDESYIYDGLPTTDVELDGCIFEIGDGTHYPNAIGTHAAYGTLPLARIKITNNIFKNFTYSAIRFLSIVDLVVDNNIFINEVDTAMGQNVVAIRLVNQSLPAESYPSVYLENIAITNNVFRRDTGYINMTAIEMYARSGANAKDILIANNVYNGAWATSSDGHDFIHFGNTENITISGNTLREPKIAFREANGTYYGSVNIVDNKVVEARDVYSSPSTSADFVPKCLTYSNNTIVKNGIFMNTSRFHEKLKLSADYTADSTVELVIPFDSYDSSTLFKPNDANKTLIPPFLHQLKISGKVNFSVATSREVYCRFCHYESVQATKTICEWRQYCVAGQKYDLTLPETFYDSVDVTEPTTDGGKDQVWFAFGVQSGDKIYAQGTELNLMGY